MVNKLSLFLIWLFWWFYFVITESRWNMEELLFRHRSLPECSLYTLLWLLWNKTFCCRGSPAIRSSWKLCRPVELTTPCHVLYLQIRCILFLGFHITVILPMFWILCEIHNISVSTLQLSFISFNLCQCFSFSISFLM